MEEVNKQIKIILSSRSENFLYILTESDKQFSN